MIVVDQFSILAFTMYALLLACSGDYLYIETSSPRRAGDTAIFNSPSFASPATPKSCQFNFWYHMYGSSTGSLTLNLTTGGTTTTVVTKRGEDKNQWQYVAVPLNSVKADFQVRNIWRAACDSQPSRRRDL